MTSLFCLAISCSLCITLCSTLSVGSCLGSLSVYALEDHVIVSCAMPSITYTLRYAPPELTYNSHATCRYVTNNTRISFQEETKLNMEAEEEKTYLQQRRASQEGASSSASSSSGAAGSHPGSAGATSNGPSFHFICECFFLTAKGLHLGLSKAITESADVARVSS